MSNGFPCGFVPFPRGSKQNHTESARHRRAASGAVPGYTRNRAWIRSRAGPPKMMTSPAMGKKVGSI